MCGLWEWTLKIGRGMHYRETFSFEYWNVMGYSSSLSGMDAVV